MNEPALPAEAFDANYQPDAGENAIYNKHAVDYGWSDNPGLVPTDKTWQDQWSQAFEFQRQQWINTLSTPNYVASPQPVYALRWGQQRSTDGVQDIALFSSTPQRGPWRGFFSGNLQRTAITNTYNTGDGVFLQVWAVSQTTQEPFVGPLGLADDRNDIDVQFWASLRDTDGSQESIWGQPCSSLTDFQHSNIVRQWAELAY